MGSAFYQYLSVLCGKPILISLTSRCAELDTVQVATRVISIIIFFGVGKIVHCSELVYDRLWMLWRMDGIGLSGIGLRG